MNDQIEELAPFRWKVGYYTMAPEDRDLQSTPT